MTECNYGRAVLQNIGFGGRDCVSEAGLSGCIVDGQPIERLTGALVNGAIYGVQQTGAGSKESMGFRIRYLTGILLIATLAAPASPNARTTPVQIAGFQSSRRWARIRCCPMQSRRDHVDSFSHHPALPF